MVGTVSGKEICLREYTYTVCLISIGLTDCVTSCVRGITREITHRLAVLLLTEILIYPNPIYVYVLTKTIFLLLY